MKSHGNMEKIWEKKSSSLLKGSRNIESQVYIRNSKVLENSQMVQSLGWGQYSFTSGHSCLFNYLFFTVAPSLVSIGATSCKKEDHQHLGYAIEFHCLQDKKSLPDLLIWNSDPF